MDRYLHTKPKKVVKSKTGPQIKKQTEDKLDISIEYKNTICQSAYIGKKGYTISKSLLTKEEYEFLKKDLFVKPQVLGASY